MFLQLLLALVFIATAFADQLLFTIMPPSIPGNATVMTYDTATKKTAPLAGYAESSYTGYGFVSGAASCGSRYYASASDLSIDNGIFVVDSSTGQQHLFDWNELGNKDLFHNVFCDPADYTSFYTVMTTPGQDVLTWTVRHVTVSKDFKLTRKDVASFPNIRGYSYGGSDLAFSATPDMKEIYAVFQNKQYSSGVICVMDIKSTETTTYTIKDDDAGAPLYVVPTTSGATSMTGFIRRGYSNTMPIYQVTFTLNKSSKIAATSAMKDTTGLEHYTMPYAWSSDGTQIVMIDSTSQPDQTILFKDAKTGEIKDTVNLSDLFGKVSHQSGALAVTKAY